MRLVFNKTCSQWSMVVKELTINDKVSSLSNLGHMLSVVSINCFEDRFCASTRCGIRVGRQF